MNNDEVARWICAMHVALDEMASEHTVFILDELPEHGFLIDCPQAVQ